LVELLRGGDLAAPEDELLFAEESSLDAVEGGAAAREEVREGASPGSALGFELARGRLGGDAGGEADIEDCEAGRAEDEREDDGG